MKESRPMNKPKTNLHVPKDRFFLLGAGLFFLGLIGTVIGLQQAQQRRVDHLIGQNTLATVEVKLNAKNANFIADKLNLESSTAIPLLGSTNQLTAESFKPWIGKQLVLSWHPKQAFLHAFDYRRKVDAKEFMQQFLLPSETLAEQNSEFGTIYTPSYSSNHAFLFYKGWLMWANNPATLVQQLSEPKKLYQYKPYTQLKKDLPSLKLAHTYINFSGDTSDLTARSENQALAPLMQGLGRSTPHWALALEVEDKTLNGDIKMLTHEALYDPTQVVSKAKNRTIPDLAYFAPKNALFFQNGHDLYAKYLHTKSYLNELDPQLALVFEGLIRAQAETWFGTNFDFEEEFLSLIRGPYAFVLDFNQALEIGFISSLDADQDPEQINQLIQKAQSRFTPVTESVELPDGSTREELVAIDPANLPISQNELQGQTYYSAKKDDGSINFSYSQIGDYLVMTNRANLVQKIISTQADQSKSLAANQDFRHSVLYDFSNAEVYGFLNAPKLAQLNLYWQETTGTQSPVSLQIISSLRNLTFSKQVFTDGIFMKLRAFFN